MTTAHLPRGDFRIPVLEYAMAFLLCAGSAAAQSATFEYSEGTLLMDGEIDSYTPNALVNALDSYPDVEWIIMRNVPGSEDDEANLKAARIIRQEGLNTGVLANGLIASGGTDFFLAGVERIVQRGACIGVHSWSDDEDPTPPTQLPRNHPGHQMFLAYYAELGVPEDFYWYTINAATAEGMHYMTEAEIRSYGMATDFEGDDPWDLSSCDDR